MHNAGVIAIHPEGEYNNSTQYTRLACVTFNGALYLSKRATVGHDPLDTYYWMFMMEEGSGTSSVNITYTDPGIGSTLKTGDVLAVVHNDETANNEAHVDKLYIGVNNLAADYVPENHTTKNITLLASGWSNKQYVVSDEDITVGSDGVIGLNADATEEQRAAVRDAMIGVKAQAAGSLTLVADGDVPTINVPITLILLK